MEEEIFIHKFFRNPVCKFAVNWNVILNPSNFKRKLRKFYKSFLLSSFMRFIMSHLNICLVVEKFSLFTFFFFFSTRKIDTSIFIQC